MTSKDVYPRDMVGYGRTPPFADWPNGARVAVQFVINYEEGGENNILHGDAASEAFLSEIVGAAPWPGMRHMNMESIYEYGSRAGFWRLHRLFTERGMPVTVYAVATAMARNPEAVAAMNEAGWEIATHGLKWIDYRDAPAELKREHIAEAVRIHAEVAGEPPARLLSGPLVDQHDPARHGGGRLPLLRRHIRRRSALLARGAARAAAHRPLHARLQRHALRHAAGLQLRRPVLRLSQGRLRRALRRGRRRAEDAVGRPALPPGRTAGPRRRRSRASSTMCSRTTRSGFRPGSTSPATGSAGIRRRADGSRRSSHGRCSSSASAAFTSIRPGSRRRPTTPGCLRTPIRRRGSPRRLPRPRRKAVTAQKRALIDAHPDLAGRLALAKRLTAESTGEQASAGLDRLTRGGAARSSPRSTTPIAPASAFPSSWRSRAGPRRTSSPPSSARLSNDADAETRTALAEIDRIAALRLQDILP